MTRSEVLEAARNSMLSKEPPAAAADRVDILAGSDDEAVTFTSAWETEG